MTPCTLIAKHVKKDVPLGGLEIMEEVCCVSGQKTQCVPVKELISASFNDARFFWIEGGRWIGVEVYQAWRYGVMQEGKKRLFNPERMSCWVAHNDAVEWKIGRIRIRELALSGCSASPWACWVTTGYKKHGSLRAKVNISQRGIIAFDEVLVDCTGEKIDPVYRRLSKMQTAGFSRPTLETLICPPAVLRKLDFKLWMAFCNWAKAWYTSPVYQFCCYMLPSKAEIDAGGES